MREEYIYGSLKDSLLVNAWHTDGIGWNLHISKWVWLIANRDNN
jgi:hypothetical protein